MLYKESMNRDASIIIINDLLMKSKGVFAEEAPSPHLRKGGSVPVKRRPSLYSAKCGRAVPL
jgi:hypothetical protein